MMPDIFSSFDPASFNYMIPSMTLMFLINIMFILTMDRSVWAINLNRSVLTLTIIKTLTPESDRTFMFNMNPLTLIMTSIFYTVVSLNLMGLFPYTFSSSSHLLFTLTLGLPMWLMLIVSSTTKSPSATIAHLLPEGAPTWLNPFLVLIESSSIIVRPITLSFRLAANMSAGHIVLSLVGIYAAAAWFNSAVSMILLIITTMGYIMFEVAICIIQAYIFYLLLTLYSNDHAH